MPTNSINNKSVSQFALLPFLFEGRFIMQTSISALSPIEAFFDQNHFIF